MKFATFSGTGVSPVRCSQAVFFLLSAALAGCLSVPEPAVTVLMAPDAEHALATRKHQGIPSIAVSKVNGRMWSTFYGDPMGGENHLNYCVLTTSADGGKTWKEVLIADPDGAGLKRAFDPEVWIAPDGKLRWTWVERTLDPEKTDLNHVWNGGNNTASDRLQIVELDAENEPTAPYPEVRGLMHGVMMCKPTAVRSGDWVFPLAVWQGEPSSCFYATRDGRDFTYLGGATMPKEWRQFDEEKFVELRDGSWWVLMRTKSGLAESRSYDRGKTWTPAVVSKLGHPNSRAFVTTLPSGNLLLVKHGRIGEEPEGKEWKVRKDLRAFISKDDGKTWLGGLLIDGRVNVSYPDGDVDKDGRIVVTYDHERQKCQEILFARFTEQDVINGDADAPGVELRQVVSRKAVK